MPTSTRERIGGDIWCRLFQSIEPAMRAEAAHAILSMKFPARDIARVRKLAEKARAGELTPDEQFEAETYGELGSILSIMQSKARMALRDLGRKTKRAKAPAV
jgi:hypothetical protein